MKNKIGINSSYNLFGGDRFVRRKKVVMFHSFGLTALFWLSLFRALKRLASGCLLVVVVGLLAGCGGGSGGGDSVPSEPVVPSSFELVQTAISGSVDLPSPDNQNFTIKSVLGSSTARSGEVATVTLYNNGPQLSLVEDEAGNSLLPVMLSKDYPAANPRSMAVAMAFIGTGLYHLDGSVAKNAVLELYESGELDNLEEAIRTSLAAGESGNNLLALVKPEIDAIVAANPRRSGGVSALGVLITPSASRSGVEIAQVDGNDFLVTNYFRRRSNLFLERTGYVDENDNFIEAPEQLQNVQITPTSGFNGVVSTIMAAFLKGDFAYEPVKFGPFPIPAVPASAKETRYKATVVGIGLSPGDFAGITSDQQAAQAEMVVRSVLLDFTIPLVVNLILPIDEGGYRLFIDHVEQNSLLIDLARSVFSQSGGVVDKIQSGDWSGAISSAVSGVLDTGTVRDTFLTTVSGFLKGYKGEAVANSFLISAAEFTNALVAVDLLGAAFDAGLQVTNIAQSNAADITHFRVTPLQAKLIPAKKVISNGQTPTQTVEFRWVDNPPAEMQVEYSYEAASGKASFDNGQATWTTTNTHLNYYPFPDFEGLETIIATATNKTTGAVLSRLSCTFQVIKAKVSIAPSATSLKSGEHQNFTAVYVPDDMEPTRYSYKILSGDGSLNVSEDTLLVTSNVQYLAESSTGTATLEVSAHRIIDNHWQVVSTDTAEIRLEERKSIIAGSWTIEYTVPAPGFTQATAYVVVPKVDGAIRYSALMEDPTGDPAGGVFFPSTRIITPEALGYWEDRGGAYWSGLSGGGGADPWATTNVAPWLTSRFSDMQVIVTVTYE